MLGETYSFEIKTENSHKKIDFNEMFKEVDLYGDINAVSDNQKIAAIRHFFARGSFKDSLYKNELYILNDNTGFYRDCCGDYMLCTYTVVGAISCSDPDENAIYVKTDKYLGTATYKDVYNCLDNSRKEKADEAINELYEESPKIYFELEANEKGKFQVYLEYKDQCFDFEIGSAKGIRVYLDGVEFETDYYWNIKSAIEDKLNEKVQKYLGKNIIKLENGFVYNNNYYEDFEDVVKVIDDEDKKC